MEYLAVLAWATVGSIVSLVGGLLLISNRKARTKVAHLAMAFGAGALLAAAFLSLLPEALETNEDRMVLMLAMAGFLSFFMLERLIGWFHHHHHDDEVDGAKDRAHIIMVIVGDTLHNIIDGMALGAAFLISPAVGVTTSLEIAAHEVPQEIGDFGILLGKGMRPRRVVLVNLISAAATIVAALSVFWLGGLYSIDAAPLMAVAAGIFIYIAASDLIPDIHERPRKEGNLQALLLIGGVVTIGAVTLLLPHEHHHSDEHPRGHDHSQQESLQPH